MTTITLPTGTTSHANFLREKTGILQLLTPKHSNIVRCLGGTTLSKDPTINKQEICASHGHTWMEIKTGDEGNVSRTKSPLLLPKCAGYLRLTLQGDVIDVGGHDVVLCQVMSNRFIFHHPAYHNQIIYDIRWTKCFSTTSRRIKYGVLMMNHI